MVRLRQQNSSFLLLEASHIKRKIDGNSYLINRNLSKRQIHNLISHFYVPVPKSRKHLIQVPRIFLVQKDYTQLVAEFPHNPCE